MRRRGASMLHLPLVVSFVCNVRFLLGSSRRKDHLYQPRFSVKLLGQETALRSGQASV